MEVYLAKGNGNNGINLAIMGCDIHCHLEARKKGEKDWKWLALETEDGESVPVYNDRNYELFTRLSNVRGICNNAIAENRGLPPDITPITRRSADVWKDCGYGWSWIGGYELDNYNYRELRTMKANIAYVLGAYQMWFYEYRVVFWFDN